MVYFKIECIHMTAKLNFHRSLLLSSVKHEPSEIISAEKMSRLFMVAVVMHTMNRVENKYGIY